MTSTIDVSEFAKLDPDEQDSILADNERMLQHKLNDATFRFYKISRRFLDHNQAVLEAQQELLGIPEHLLHVPVDSKSEPDIATVNAPMAMLTLD